MQKVAKLAALALSVSLIGIAVATPADAQRRNRGGDAEEGDRSRQPAVSRPFATAYQPTNAAIEASDWATADTALAALRAAASTDYERFLVAQTEFRIASGQHNEARQASAITAMIDSNGAPAASQASIYTGGAQIAYNTGDYAAAAARAKRAIELGATAEGLTNLMIDAYFRAGQTDQGLAEANAVINAAESAGRPAPEGVYSLTARALQEADRTPELLTSLVKRANAYPSELNIRSAALVYLQTVPEDRGISIDALRLVSAANAMNDRRYYVEYVSTLAEDAQPAEALRAIAAGRAANLIPANDTTFREIETTQRDNVAEDRASLAGAERRAVASPEARLMTRVADAYLSHENYAKAEELYTQALGKTGADAGLINTRLGIARFRAGNYAGAVEAFAQVQQGNRVPLARLWEGYARSRGGAAPAAAQPAN